MQSVHDRYLHFGWGAALEQHPHGGVHVLIGVHRQEQHLVCARGTGRVNGHTKNAAGRGS